jgi:Acyl-CoA reductase (LuxC)
MNGGEALRQLAGTLSEAGEALWEAGGERRARWLATAFAHLSRSDSELGREAVAVLAASSGLSEPMIVWALDSTLAPLTFEVLRELERAPVAPRAGAVRARAGRLCALVLAGNVVTAAARAVGYPLLFGWPVLAKASSGDDALARLLEAALAESDPALADAYRVVSYAAEQEALNVALLEQADAVVVYGSDQTVNAIRAQLGATVSFIGHGHGLGAAFVARAALSAQAAPDAARGLALDVAAYDQRGCLSPHVAWVERGGEVSPEAFAALVRRELAQLAVTLPRGRLPIELAGAQLSWRGVGAMRGTLLEGDGFAVSCEDEGPLRVSPGYRNLQLLALEDERMLPARLAPLGVHLKSLAVAGVTDLAGLVRALPPRVAPRVCALGQMQLPPPEALHDALPVWEGLLRWVDG